MPKALPPHPHIDWLKKAAKERLHAMRVRDRAAKLHQAQHEIAKEYGFASWRRLKAHIDQNDRKPIFEAARRGDLETVRRALEAGFDPGIIDDDGRTIHQIAKANGYEDIELLARQFQERDTHPAEQRKVVNSILDAAEKGRAEELARLLDANPDLIDARGGNFQKQSALHKAAWRNRADCVRLLLERDANVRIRDYGDNAYALHFAAEAADFEIVQLLVEAGSDVIGEGDDHQLGVIGWATCLGRVREDVADYLLRNGARLDLWSAIALERPDEVRHFVTRDPAVLTSRMSRNEHYRTPLHHAAAKNRPRTVRLLLDLGADVNARDATGATAMTTAAQENADPGIVSMLQEAGAKLDFIAALNLARYDLADAMLRDDPSRIGPQGQDTIALHLAAARKNLGTLRWVIAHGVDINAKRKLWDCAHTALHIAAADGTVDIARILLDAGADPNIRDDKYEATVLGWAEYCDQPDVARLVRERGGA
jgi:ankyrin repeat protein